MTRRDSWLIWRRRVALASYLIWWSQPGSNRRPSGCKPDALPAELWPLPLDLLSPGGVAAWLRSSHTICMLRCSPAPRLASRQNLGAEVLPIRSTPGPTSLRLIWWVWEELNLRPHPYQGCALTN